MNVAAGDPTRISLRGPQARRPKRLTASALAKLDEFLNARILTAATNTEMAAAWTLKIHVKRRLEGFPQVDVEREAGPILHELLSEPAA